MKYQTIELEKEPAFTKIYKLRTGPSIDDAVNNLGGVIGTINISKANIYVYPTPVGYEATLGIIDETHSSPENLSAKERLGRMPGFFDGDWDRLTEEGARIILEALTKQQRRGAVSETLNATPFS